MLDVVSSSMVSIENVAVNMESVKEDQSAGTQRVLTACEKMRQGVEKFNQEGVVMADSSEELKELSNNLEKLIEQFHIE